MDIGSIVSESLRLYSELQKSHPLIGSMVAAEAIFVAGDAISQLIADKNIDKRRIIYTATLAPVYGICVKGLMESGELAGKYLSENPLVKAALGPNLWGNAFNTFFFVNNTVGERGDYSLKNLLKNYKYIFTRDNRRMKNIKERLKHSYFDNIPKKEYFYSVTVTLTAWNVFQYMNYSHIQDDLRTSASLAASVLWTGLLSLWSLKGSREIISKQ